jgi:3-oxoadipate enol-lactonase
MPQVQLGDIRIAYQWDGAENAPPLVLSNSLGATMAMWEPQMSALSARFRVLRYDARGHGQSQVPPGPYSIPQLGADLLNLLDHLNIPRAHFCGLSMGGMVGMWLGVNAPTHVDRLVLCNTAARIGTADSWNTRIASVRDGGMTAIGEALLGRWFTAPFLSAQRLEVERARRMLFDTPPEGYVAGCAAVRDADLRDDVGRIFARTLVITGRHDVATPPIDGRYLADRIDGARYVELDAAHVSNLERPAEFTRALIEFLTE